MLVGIFIVFFSLFVCAEAPHWLRSIHQLTETDGPAQNSRFSFAQQIPMGPASGWPQQMQNPPPGFRNPMRSSLTEAHKLEGNYLLLMQ
jgi:hypothetical protein